MTNSPEKRPMRSLHAPVFVFIFVAACAGGTNIADDWPNWRGTRHDAMSFETGLADSWPDAGPPVLWTREIGKGYSSFISVGDRVWTQTQTLYEQAVICLDARTGETVWSKKYGWPYDGGGLYPGPRSTPTWHEGRIYYAAPEGTIGCLDANTGRSIWEANPKQQFHGKGTDFGCAASPLVIDGKVIIPVGGADAGVVALHANNGSVAWQSGGSPASYSTMLPITLNGRPRIVALLENSLALIDRDNGRLLWEDEFSSGYDEHSAAPLYREPFLMIAGPFRSGARCYRLEEPDGSSDSIKLKATTIWESTKLSNDIASSVLVDGYVYGFDLRDIQSRLNRPSRGEFRCLDFSTGKVLWSTDQVGHANIIVADQKLILFNDKGEVILARVNPERYEDLARTQVFNDEICWSSAALGQGRLYLRTQTRSVCLYLGMESLKDSGATKSVADIPHAKTFNPTPLLGGEREFPATVPEWSELRLWWQYGIWSLLLAAVLEGFVSFGRWAITARTSAKNPLVPQDTNHGTCSVPRIAFWIATIVTGCVGSPLLNHRSEEYVFLWPLVLWASLQLTLIAVIWAESQQKDRRKRARWVSRLAGLSLIAISALYFHLCRRLGMSIEWGFLSGFLPAFFTCAIAARGLLWKHRYFPITDFVIAVISFSAYYGSCSYFLRWWLRVGT